MRGRRRIECMHAPVRPVHSGDHRIDLIGTAHMSYYDDVACQAEPGGAAWHGHRTCDIARKRPIVKRYCWPRCMLRASELRTMFDRALQHY